MAASDRPRRRPAALQRKPAAGRSRETEVSSPTHEPGPAAGRSEGTEVSNPTREPGPWRLRTDLARDPQRCSAVQQPGARRGPSSATHDVSPAP